MPKRRSTTQRWRCQRRPIASRNVPLRSECRSHRAAELHSVWRFPPHRIRPPAHSRRRDTDLPSNRGTCERRAHREKLESCLFPALVSRRPDELPAQDSTRIRPQLPREPSWRASARQLVLERGTFTVFSVSSRRHRYHDAIVRYGAHFAPIFDTRLGSGCFRNPYARLTPF